MKRILVLSLLLLTCQAFAESVAVILFANNKVIAKTNNVERNLTRGTPLEVGDIITTYDKSITYFKYNNGTIVHLGENTSYTILSYLPKQSDIAIEAELSYGKMHSETSGQLKETLKTPLVKLAILGTDYNVYVPDAKTVHLKVNKGRVQAKNRVYTPGQSFVATPKGIYDAPFPKAGFVLAKNANLKPIQPFAAKLPAHPPIANPKPVKNIKPEQHSIKNNPKTIKPVDKKPVPHTAAKPVTHKPTKLEPHKPAKPMTKKPVKPVTSKPVKHITPKPVARPKPPMKKPIPHQKAPKINKKIPRWSS